MFVPLLILLLGTTVIAGNEDLFEGDMVLNAEQKEMLAKSLILTPEDQAKADKEAKGEGEKVTEGNEDLFEGDMVLNAEQKEMLAKSLILTPEDQAKADKEAKGEGEKVTEDDAETGKSFFGYEQFKWPGNTLYYDLSEISWWGNWGLKSKIKSALKDLQTKVGNCVKFVEKESGPRVEVHTHNKEGCFALVGYQYYSSRKEVQRLNLGSTCTSRGTIQHEFMHALGFFHMQARSDRDNYITIMEDNIRDSEKSQFAKYGPRMIKHFGLPFDYSSLMMYGSYDFSKNGKKTIVTKDPSKQKLIGKGNKLTEGDIKMIRIAYGCS